jgi:hypothetical protein
MTDFYVIDGGDLMYFRYILRHSNLKMVERYSHLTLAYKRKMINNLTGAVLSAVAKKYRIFR